MRMMRHVLIALAFAITSSPLTAQTIRGALTGTVTDGTGAVVPGRSPTLSNRSAF
jgi:hypothetical protein